MDPRERASKLLQQDLFTMLGLPRSASVCDVRRIGFVEPFPGGA